MATAKKDKKIVEENEEGEATDNHLSKLNNKSGFFVFNEEDMKSMTEFSPKNKSGNIKL